MNRFTCTNIVEGMDGKIRRMRYGTDNSTLLALYSKDNSIPHWPWPEEVLCIGVFDRSTPPPKKDEWFWGWADYYFALVTYWPMETICYDWQVRYGDNHAVKYSYGGLKNRQKDAIMNNDNIKTPPNAKFLHELPPANPTKELTFPFMDAVFGYAVSGWKEDKLKESYNLAMTKLLV